MDNNLIFNQGEKLTAEQVSTFRYKLRILRKQAKISQDQLAERMEILHQDVSALERGRKKVTPDLVYKAADVFGVPADDLISKTAANGGDSRSYCLRLLNISQIIYDTPLSDIDKQILDKAITLLESVVYR